VILHFSDGETLTLPDKLASKEDALARLKELMALEEWLENKGDVTIGWRMAQVTRWEVKKASKLMVY
jgi:hypothetical protein